jgi:hypothetical protein
MKKLWLSVIIALLAVYVPAMANQERSSSDDARRLAFNPTLVLRFKVTSDYPSADQNRSEISDIRRSKLENELSFWTIVEIRVRIYKNLSNKDYTLSEKYSPDRNPGYKYLIERANFEISWPYDPYMFDPYRSFFRDSDFLFRSTRSLYHDYYSTGGYYHN